MEEPKNIKLILAYDGSRYHGWQRQKNDMTLQAVLEDKIGMMTGEPVTLLGSGRTDAGVHALHQVCNFFTRTGLDLEALRRGLNALLPADIFIKQAEVAPPDFHARYSAKGKAYEYRILNRPEPDIFLRRHVWHIPASLDYDLMRACLSLLTGRHDFSAFRSSGSANINPVRDMKRADFLLSPEPGHFSLIFEADGFLRHMVRNIVGTLYDVGRGRTGQEEFLDIFRSGDRTRAGVKAPPQGLFLTKVFYSSLREDR
ncbi:MAG: tRNA pseudouridine(38-40) synthase TruA [Pseudomonadota bacterium]